MANYPKPKKGTRHNANAGFKSGIRLQLREDRQVQAKIRQELYDAKSLEQKLAELGPTGSKKQRYRLAVAIAAKNAAVAAPKKEKRS